MTKSRVKFFSEHDMASGWHLKKIESYMEQWSGYTEVRGINDVLELYNIRKYIDAGLRLEYWDEERLTAIEIRLN